jgi:hypothetical protein
MIMNPQHPPSSIDDANLTVNLTVSLHKVWDNECMIDLKLTNTSRSVLELYTHSLPWRGHYSMVLVAADTLPAGNAVARSLMIDDPPFAFTTLKPGESLQGEIRLASRIPDIITMLRKRDMILFWAYRPTTVTQARGRWVGGWLLLPKLP